MKIPLTNMCIPDLRLYRSCNAIFSAPRGRILIVLAALAIFCGGAGIVAFQALLPADRADSVPVIFRVEKRESYYHIASKLKEAGIIRSRAAFMVYGIITWQATKLQHGEYELAPSLSAQTILRRLSTGDVLKEYITIKEGWNLFDIASEFETRDLFSKEEFFAVAGYPTTDYRETTSLPGPKDFSQEFAFLQDKPPYVSLEGYLFPDTYQITAHEAPESFVRRALRNFEANLTPELLRRIEERGETLFETVTWAAMVEKEVRIFEDKQRVAGLLQKRMENGMRLQTDATVVYVRDGNHYRVSIAETQIESPYNTYRVYGLPLGPISNPGLESIQAVLEPVESPYWYYLSTPTGETIFSKTLEEHNQVKAKYLR